MKNEVNEETIVTKESSTTKTNTNILRDKKWIIPLITFIVIAGVCITFMCVKSYNDNYLEPIETTGEMTSFNPNKDWFYYSEKSFSENDQETIRSLMDQVEEESKNPVEGENLTWERSGDPDYARSIVGVAGLDNLNLVFDYDVKTGMTTWQADSMAVSRHIQAREKTVEAIKSLGLDVSTDRYDAALRIARYVSDLATYNPDAENKDALSVFEGSSSSEGYAELYQMMCAAVGIPCKMIKVDCNGETRTINQVEIGGNWYYIDVAKNSEVGNNYYLFSSELWEGYAPYEEKPKEQSIVYDDGEFRNHKAQNDSQENTN